MKALRILALLLALCMLLTACLTNGAATAVSATYSGGDLPAGVYLYYLATSTSKVTSALEIYDETVLNETYEGKNAAEWIVNDARESLRTHAVVEAKFAELGLSLGEDIINYADATLSTFWAKYGHEMKQYGIAKSSADLVILNNIKSDILITALYGEGGEHEISEDELLDYYKENYRRTILLVMPMANMSEESFAIKERLFDEYYDRIRNGEDIYDLIIEEYARTGGLTIDETREVFKNDTQIQVISRDVALPEALIDQIFSTTELDVPQQYSDGDFNIIFEVRDLVRDGFNFNYMRETLLTKCADEDYRAKLSDWADSINFVENSAAIERYQPTRILEVKNK